MMVFPYLQNEDIGKIMEWITEYHTLNYKTDLAYDLEKIKNFGKEGRTEQNFFFLSRRNGTNLYPERDVFLKDTAAYNGFQTYCTREDAPLLFLIELKSTENDRVIGNMTQLFYPQVALFAKENAQIPIYAVVDSSAFDQPRPFPYQEFVKRREEIDYTLGPFGTVEIKVANEPELQALIAQNRANTMGQSVEMSPLEYFGNLEDHCRELYKDNEDYMPFHTVVSSEDENHEEDEEDYNR